MNWKWWWRSKIKEPNVTEQPRPKYWTLGPRKDIYNRKLREGPPAHYQWQACTASWRWRRQTCRDETFISPNSILSVLYVSCVTTGLLPHAHTEGKREKTLYRTYWRMGLAIWEFIAKHWIEVGILRDACIAPPQRLFKTRIYMWPEGKDSVPLHPVSLAHTGSPTTMYWLSLPCLFLFADLYFLWWHWMILHLYPKATLLHAYHFHLK